MVIIVYDFTLTKIWMFKDDKDRNNKRKITKSRRYLKGEQDLVHIIWRHHLVLDEDNALIGTFENEEEESELYISYNCDSHERSDHSDANNS